MTRHAALALMLTIVLGIATAAVAAGAPVSNQRSAAAAIPTPTPAQGCYEHNPDPSRCPEHAGPPAQQPETKLEVGFGVRKITPVGEPPARWKPYFTPQPKTGVWGERYEDLDGDACYDPQREPHVDDPWNSSGDAHERGAFEVDGVTIYGDPGSTGKWDGIWTNAGFGAICAQGAHDDTYARAVVMRVEDRTVALVSIDVVGFFNYEIRRAERELRERFPNVEIDELVVSSTHTHEGPDTMGLWAQTEGLDGKSPAYQAFIRWQIENAVHDAYSSLQPSLVKFGTAEHTVGIRDSRAPEVIDPWVVAAQFLRPDDGSTIGTLVNWSNHPEAQSRPNPLISSDFPWGTRVTLEQNLGGTAVYFSGSVGGLMTPLGANVPGYGTEVSWERTFEIGRLVALAAEDALAQAPAIGIFDLDVDARVFYMDSDNNALRALNATGMFDVPTYAGYESWGRTDHHDGTYAGAAGSGFRTEMVRVSIGPAVFLTVPGELFPELEIGGYGRPDCAQADTGRPYEPVIAEQYEEDFQFVLGLAQDELGYIVPGYDFWIKHAEEAPNEVSGQWPFQDDNQGIAQLGALQARDPCGERHYEETVSASSVMAPWVTCVAAELAGIDPWALASSSEAYAACTYDNTHTDPYGVDVDQDGPAGRADPLTGYRHPAGYYEHGHEH